MFKLLPVFIISVVLAWFSHMFSNYNRAVDKYEKKENLIYFVLVVVMTVFVALRTHYNDTASYIETYVYKVPSDMDFWTSLTSVNWLKIGTNPGFVFFYRYLKYLGFTPQLFLTFFAVLTIPVYMWFIRKYTDNIFLSVILMYTIGPYVFSLAAIKQSFAMALLLIATDRAINKKYTSFVFWVLLACTIHAYSWLYFIVPFLNFKPWSKRTYWSLALFGIVGVMLSFGMNGIINITSLLGDEYSAQDMSGAGVNIYRFGVTIVPLVLSFIFRKRIQNDVNCDEDNVIINLTILHGELMFIALFGTANYFARLANYFQIFAVITMPKMFNYMNKKYRTVVTVCAMILYVLFFYYNNTISGYATFDKSFDKLTLKEFFDTAFVFQK